METRKKYFMDCHLAGRIYHDADEVWNELKVGTQLGLRLDKENRFDGNAVEVIYTNAKKEEFRLGYIPRDDNTQLAAFLEMDWTDIFECRISKLSPDAHPENQVHLTIRIKHNPKNQKEA